MACFARFSLPVSLPAPSINRLLSSPPALFALSKQLEPRQALVAAENRRPGFLRVRSMASDANSEAVVPKSVPVRVAHELLQAGHRYLDVRTVDEFNAGHPTGATNIPYMFKVGSGSGSSEV